MEGRPGPNGRDADLTRPPGRSTRNCAAHGWHALGAGGIGLKLVETMHTDRDGENTCYLILLTLMVVIAMDLLSGRLRRRLTRQQGGG